MTTYFCAPAASRVIVLGYGGLRADIENAEARAELGRDVNVIFHRKDLITQKQVDRFAAAAVENYTRPCKVTVYDSPEDYGRSEEPCP